MGRQRVLERASWTFWRCFASNWSIRKEEVLAEFLQRLSSMGSKPLGTLEKIPSLVEQRTWVPGAPVGSASEDSKQDPLEAAIKETRPL